MPYIVREQDAKKLEVSTMFGGRNVKAAMSQAIASPVSKNMTGGYLRLYPGYKKELEIPLDEIDVFLEGSLRTGLTRVGVFTCFISRCISTR